MLRFGVIAAAIVYLTGNAAAQQGYIITQIPPNLDAPQVTIVSPMFPQPIQPIQPFNLAPQVLQPSQQLIQPMQPRRPNLFGRW